MTDDHDRAALRLLRADLDQLGHHISELDRGSRHQLARTVADMLERIATGPPTGEPVALLGPLFDAHKPAPFPRYPRRVVGGPNPRR